jgi:glyoxylase I family protein
MFQSIAEAMPFEMMISGVHHVAIISSDYEKSRRFYCEMLGFRIISETYRPERHSYKLDLVLPGGIQIELFSFPDAPQRPSYPEACGLRHLAFAVPNLDGAITALLAQGIRVEEVRVDELTGRRFTFFADPDGLPLELYEEVGP